jgi:hypothetical protein
MIAALFSGCGSNLTVSPPVAKVAVMPVFTPAGGTYSKVQSVVLSSATPGSVIYYTTDGSTPTASSKQYSASISVSANMTIQALASAVGYTSSGVAKAAYVFVPEQAVAPAFSLGAGSYSGPQSVIITDATPGANIYFTVDGTSPTAASTLYCTPITISSSETLSAIAVATGFANSTVTSADYEIAPPLAASPAFSPVPGNYTGSQKVTLTDAAPGSKIYYTTDGSNPSTASALYTQPLTVASTETISAIAAAPGFTNSLMALATYSINTPQLSSPTFNPAQGSYSNPQTVTIADGTPGAAIYFTTDGSVPTKSSTLYTGPIAVSATGSLTAIAVMNGYGSSAPVTATYQIGASAAAYNFKNVQIVGGGFVDGIVFHPAQQGLIYARTDVGGAYRWSSAQNQWVPLLDYLTRDDSSYMGVESIAIDPSDPNRLYLAVGMYAESYGTNGAILISSDQGQSFTTVPLPFKLGGNDGGRFAGERLSVDPNLGTHLYFGSRLNGLWESFDAGATWAHSTTFPVQGLSSANPASTGGVIFEDFIQGSGAAGSVTPTVYIGVDDHTVDALYSTSDGGATWTGVTGQPAGLNLNRGVFGPDGNLYLAYGNNLGPEGVSGGSIWRYTPPVSSGTDGVWKDITPSPTFTNNPGTFGFGSIAVDPQHPGVIMATTLDLYYLHDDVFRSLDGGNSWIDLGGNQARNGSLSPWLNFGAVSPGIGNWLVSTAIDPYNSKHVLYGTGQTIWQTTGATAADATPTTPGTTTAGVVPTVWSVGAAGLEETVIRTLVSPPSGAKLLSGMRDIGGFTHTILDASPPAGMNANPLITDTTGLDFAQAAPAIVVRVGDGGGTQFGAYSTDYGADWTPFGSQGGSLSGGGSVALSADGKTIVWAPEDAGVSYSIDNGNHWQACSGAPPQQGILADRVNAEKFYIYNSSTGTLFRSVDGGVTFIAVTASVPKNGVMRASYAAEGDLWLATPSGLLHSADSGATFAQIAGPTAAYDVAFGKSASNAQYPTIFAYGKVAGADGVYRSIDMGTTWTAVTDAEHQFGYINVIAADPNVFGRVYLGTSGRGIIYADPAP